MARVVLFEDCPPVIRDVEAALSQGGHLLVAREETIQGAFKVLRQLLAGELETDYIIIDGNLRDERPSSPINAAGAISQNPQFRYEHPGVTERILVRDKPWKRKREVWIPKVTVFEPEQRRYQAHGRAIVDIIRSTGIKAKTIGFSLDPLTDIPVDIDDLNKNPWKLNETITRMS